MRNRTTAHGPRKYLLDLTLDLELPHCTSPAHRDVSAGRSGCKGEPLNDHRDRKQEDPQRLLKIGTFSQNLENLVELFSNLKSAR